MNNKETVLSFLEWAAENHSVYLQEMPMWTVDTYSVDNDRIINAWIEDQEVIRSTQEDGYGFITNNTEKH